jgi:hypothetical protein
VKLDTLNICRQNRWKSGLVRHTQPLLCIFLFGLPLLFNLKKKRKK